MKFEYCFQLNISSQKKYYNGTVTDSVIKKYLLEQNPHCPTIYNTDRINRSMLATGYVDVTIFKFITCGRIVYNTTSGCNEYTIYPRGFIGWRSVTPVRVSEFDELLLGERYLQKYEMWDKLEYLQLQDVNYALKYYRSIKKLSNNGIESNDINTIISI